MEPAHWYSEPMKTLFAHSGRRRVTPAIAACLVCWMLAPAIGFAQLTPEPAGRAYFGVHRPVPMKVSVPEGLSGEVRIDLFDPSKSDPAPEATAPALAGVVDLSTLFPVLWQGPSPKLRYAQLVVGGSQVGSPVVLQPLVTPVQAKLVRTATKPDAPTRDVYFKDPASATENFPAREGEIVWITEPPAYAGLRAYTDQHVVLDTSMGEIEFRLRPDAAPNTAWNFRDLSERGFFTDIIFHRVVPVAKDGHPFVVQVGDPTGGGDGGPGYNLALEKSDLGHDFGVLSMARSTDPDTAGSQVFIALSREGTARLDGKYTAFAQAVRGADVILALSRVPVTGDRPNDPPLLRSARFVPAPPYGLRPAPVQRPVEKPRGR